VGEEAKAMGEEELNCYLAMSEYAAKQAPFGYSSMVTANAYHPLRVTLALTGKFCWYLLTCTRDQ
jgi:hypothetical protein